MSVTVLTSAVGPTARVALTVHGIRTHATWQKTVTPILSNEGYTVVPHDFGKFGLLRFVREAARSKQIELLRQTYESVVANKQYLLAPEDPTRRPSVIAHSFGAYIVGRCLQRYSWIRFDKVILCGSILPAEFDWSELFGRDQVNHVRNIRCMKDPWVPKAGWAAADAGSSGVGGFSYWGSLLDEVRRDDCSHSDFFTEADVRAHWLPFLQRPPSRFNIAHSRNVDRDDDLENMLDQTHAIDTDVYSSYPRYEEQELPRGVSTGWTDVNRDIYTFVIQRESGRPVGYVNAMPISDACFDEVVSGEKQDNAITPDDVLPFEPGSTVSLYLMSIAIDPKQKSTNRGLHSEAVERLVNGVVGKLLYYATHRSVRVSRIAAVGWTAVGRKLCKQLGLVSVRRDKLGNDVFQLLLNEPMKVAAKTRHPGIRRLLHVYARLDEERQR